MEQKTGDQAREHWADAAEAPAAPGLQNICQPWGAAAEMGVGQHCLWRMGTIQSQQWGAGSQAVLGTEGQQARECEPGRGTGSLQGTQQTPHPEACAQRGTQAFPLSFVLSNVADILSSVGRGQAARHMEKCRLRLSLLTFTTPEA